MLKRRERKYCDKAAAMTRAVVPAEEMASEDVFMQAAPQVQARAERVAWFSRGIREGLICPSPSGERMIRSR